MNRPLRRAHAIAGLLLLLSPPASAQTVYAVVWGNPSFVVGSSTLHSGLFRSTDRGASWEHLGPRNLKAFGMDAVDSTRGRVLYIAAGNGVHRSLDSGRSWRIVTDWRVTEVLDVAVNQHNPREVYAATAYGFIRSTDGGDSWANPAGSLQSSFVSELSFDGELEALTDDAPFSAGILYRWRSTDGGRSWSAHGSVRRGGPPVADSVAAHSFRPEIAGTTLAATWGSGVYRRDDGRWQPSGLAGSQVWRLVVTEY